MGYQIRTWETAQGLPENSATSMVQTSDGYLWVGTFDGLVRFDGVKFDVFDPSTLPELPGAGVVNLFLDGAQRLWVSTLNGMAVRENGVWRRISSQDGWVGNFAASFSERGNGDLFITTFDGRLLEYSGGKFHRLPPPAAPGPSLSVRGTCDGAGRWWVVHYGFVGTWDGQRWVEAAKGLAGRGEAMCGRARDGGVWIFGEKTLLKYTSPTSVVRYDTPAIQGGPWSLFEDSTGAVWVCSYDRGLYRWTPDGHVDAWSSADGLSHDCVRFAFEDHEKSMWIGTSGGGLMQFRPRRVRNFGIEDGIAERLVNSVSLDATGRALVATYGKGVFRLGGDRATRVLTGEFGFIQSVLADRSGREWAGVFDQGLWVIDGATSRKTDLPTLAGQNVTSMFEDSGGRLWAAGGKALAVLDGTSWKVYGVDAGLPMSAVLAIAEDELGRIWVSNPRSVYRLENERFSEVRDASGNSIPAIACLKPGGAGMVWMGSRTDGLVRWRDGRLDRLAGRLGVEARGVFGILEDERGFWWMPTNVGLVRGEREQLEAAADDPYKVAHCQLLGVEDGLSTTEMSGGRQPVCGSDGSGRLWFATRKGVAMVDPACFRVNDVPPQVRIEGVWYTSAARDSARTDRRASLEEATLPSSGRLTLEPGCRRLEFRYTALSFADPHQVRFQVRMSGLDDVWRDVGEDRATSYNDVAPGVYEFRVRAANNDGVWNEVGASLPLRVEAFFWETGLFRAGVGAFLILSGALVTWWLASNHLSRMRERLELQTQRTELAHLSRVTMLGELSGSLAHELNQPLTAILSNAQAAQRYLARDPVEVGEVREILTDIVAQDKRAGEVIHRLRALLKKGEVRHEPLDIGKVVREVLWLMRSDLINHGVEATVELPEKLPGVNGDRVQLQQVLLNLLMNGCDAMSELPAEEKHICVRAQVEGKLVRVSVRDRGCGISTDQAERIFEPFFTTKPNGMGLGLAVCRTIMRSHRGDLSAEASKGGRGATFSFTLPAINEVDA
jgi:signal transduction histidine kinase